MRADDGLARRSAPRWVGDLAAVLAKHIDARRGTEVGG